MTGTAFSSGVADRSRRQVRIRAFLLVAILHGLGVVALVRAFAPDLASRAVDRVVATFVSSPEPSPTPPARARPAAGAAAGAGAAGAAGKRAVPREMAARPPRVVIAQQATAPPVASTGAADSAGAQLSGLGTGAAGRGEGPGAAGGGTGQGAGGGSAAVKIAGDINSARDYPIASRDLRIGDHVIVALTVGIDGRPTACRIVRASRDAAADAITCRLALARFRFRPATNASGQPVEATYGWQQRWFLKDTP